MVSEKLRIITMVIAFAFLFLFLTTLISNNFLTNAKLDTSVMIIHNELRNDLSNIKHNVLKNRNSLEKGTYKYSYYDFQKQFDTWKYFLNLISSEPYLKDSIKGNFGSGGYVVPYNEAVYGNYLKDLYYLTYGGMDSYKSFSFVGYFTADKYDIPVKERIRIGLKCINYCLSKLEKYSVYESELSNTLYMVEYPYLRLSGQERIKYIFSTFENAHQIIIDELEKFKIEG